ncbi:TlpA disulfide reductase family protein [uncultured Pseudoteredinibacter sp.]|uniref:TlpA disulfide reductase family protein n=1 Tax=uncultured Pseudoteredinibacter sp. TaxID=1641701 RepID=UPI00262E387D|nr:TlpA disulfide reductase family protein [uncultured Pseudoteredinibacter sp.]
MKAKRFSKNLLAGAFVLAGLLLNGCDSANKLPLANGEAIDLQAEQTLVINYWADWCKPCRHEIPELNQLDKEEGITVIGIDFDKHQGQQLDDLIEDMKIDFAVLAGDLEPNAIHPELSRQAKALPMTYLITIPTQASGKSAQLSPVFLGPQTKEGLLKKISAFKSMRAKSS